MKQEAPQPRRSRTGTPAIHGGEHVKTSQRYAVAGVVLGALVRFLLGRAWPIPPAFPAVQGFPAGGVTSLAATVGGAMFVAGFTFTAVRAGNLRAFTLGICAGAASVSQYAAIGISTAAAAGLMVLVLIPVCALVGMSAGIFAALAFRARIPEFGARRRHD